VCLCRVSVKVSVSLCPNGDMVTLLIK